MLNIGDPPLLSSELDTEPGPKVLAHRVIQETECRSGKMGDVVEYPKRRDRGKKSTPSAHVRPAQA